MSKKKFTTSNVLNTLRENAMIFPVEKGETFKEGELVVLDPKLAMVSHPKKAKGYVFLGRAVTTLKNDYGTDMLICKDGVYLCHNLLDSDFTVTENDIGEYCYFENHNTVSMDSTGTTAAGRIIGITEDRVIVRVDIYKEEYV